MIRMTDNLRGKILAYIEDRRCQTKNGGFSRTMHGGMATLEHTFYAVNGLKLLSAL
jgi:hypothetical protein